MSDSGQLKEYVHMLKLELADGHVWHLCHGHYKAYGLTYGLAYGLSSLVMGASKEVLPQHSNHSTIDISRSVWY